MEEKQLEDHCDQVAKAHIDNFESGLFPPDLLLPKRPGRTFHPQIYNSWWKPENEERKKSENQKTDDWHKRLLLNRKL